MKNPERMPPPKVLQLFIYAIWSLLPTLSVASNTHAYDGHYVWEQVPVYAEEYRPRHIKEGFQMTHALAYAPSDPSIVYLCTDTSRVWRSSDGGQSWKQIGNGMASNGCRSLAVDPVNPRRVIAAGFLGVDEKAGRHRKWKLQGLYLTENGGETWELVRRANFFRQVSKSPLIAYDSSTIENDKTNVWYAGTYDEGLLKSEDGGLNWKTIVPDLLRSCDVKEITDRPGHLLIATESGLYNYDKKEVSKIGKGLPKGACAIGVHPADWRTVIAAAGKKGIYRSIDGGENFEVSNGGMPLMPQNIVSVAISKKPPFIMYAKAHESGWRLPFYSKNAGLTWVQGQYGKFTRTHSVKKHFWFSSIFAPHPVDPKQCLVISSGDGKVFKTKDGGATWELYGSGYTGARVMSMAFDKKSVLMALTDVGVWSRNRGDEYFRELSTPRYKGAMSSHLVGRAGDMIVATVGNWGDQCIGTRSPSGSWKLKPKIHGRFKYLGVHPKDPDIIYIDRFRSLDRGKTWTRLPKSVSAISENPLGRIYALESGADKHTTTISISDDGGESWSPHTPSVPVARSRINKLVLDPHNSSRIYLASNGGVWVFNGKAWTLKANKEGLARDQFGLTYISALIADPSRPGRLFAGKAAPGRGVSNGLFASDDGGESWHSISGNLGNGLYVWSLHLDSVDATLYAGTDRGLMKLNLGH